MLSGNDNPSPRWMVMLCAGTVSLLIAFMSDPSAVLAVPGTPGNTPSSPSAPTGPTSKDVAAPPPTPTAPNASSNAPTAPNAPSPADEQRLIDLARRMATTQPKAPGAPISTDAGTSDAKPQAAPVSSDEARAAKSNGQKLSDPDDRRPLGPRSRAAGTGDDAKPTAPTGSSTLSLIGALGVVIVLIFALRAGLRRYLGGAVAAGQSSVVQVLSRIAVAPRNHVLLLRVGGRVLVVSDSTAGMRTLAAIDDPQEVADLLTAVSSAKPTSVTGGFRQLLSTLGGAYDKKPAALEGADENEFQIDRARDKVSGLLGKLRNLTGKGGES